MPRFRPGSLSIEAWLEAYRRACPGVKLTREGAESSGPCPLCGGSDRFHVKPRSGGGVLASCRGDCTFGQLARHLFPDGNGNGADGGKLLVVGATPASELRAREARRARRGSWSTSTTAPTSTTATSTAIPTEWDTSPDPPKALRHPGDDRIPAGMRPEAFPVRDVGDRLFAAHCRFDLDDGGKTFRWWRDGWGLGGLSPLAAPLYLSERLPGYDPARRLWVVEGETCADLLDALGAQVVATVTGAGKGKTHMAHVWESLRSFREVVLWPDNDQPGTDHMEASRLVLASLGVKVSVVQISGLGLPPKGDVVDWYRRLDADGATREKIRAELDALPVVDPDALLRPLLRPIPVLDFLRRSFPPPEPYLGPVVHSRQLALLFADRGVGKTHMALSLAVSVSVGASMWGWEGSGKPRSVLYVDGEMPPDLLQKWTEGLLLGMESEGTDVGCSRLAILSKAVLYDDAGHLLQPLNTPEGQAWLEPYLDGVELLILDNLATLTDLEENEAKAWKPVQEWLVSLRTRGMSVWVLHHANKSGGQRGTSAHEDVLDVVVRLYRPDGWTQEDGCRFNVDFTKARRFRGEAAQSLAVELTTAEHDRGQLLTDRPHLTDLIGRPAAIAANVWAFGPIEDDDKRAQAREMHADGKSLRAIARELQVGKSSVNRWVKGGSA